MIYGVGTDIVKIERMARSLERTEGFKKKIFTQQEIDYCSEKAFAPQHFSGMFAVKESFIKAFKEGMSGGMKYCDIEILHYEDGAPYLNLSGITKEKFESKKLAAAHISISHDTDFATAVVIIEK
ncbi:MAG: holo-ACP synthase [Candidatus Wallbacteria bacterium]